MNAKKRRVRPRKGTVDLPAEVVAQQTSTLDAPRRVTDLATGLPSITSLFSDMRPLVEDPAGATILYVHLSSNQLIEERFGWEAQSAYVELVTSDLNRVAKNIQRERDACVIARAFADDYVLVFPHRSDDELVTTRIADEMNRHIQAVDDDLASLHEVYLGMTHVVPFSRIHPERLIYRGISRAQAQATDVGRQRLAAQLRVLDRCISRTDPLSMVFQPLIRLEDESIFAYEALARCSEPALRSPHLLIKVAEQGDRVWALSRVLRRKAIEAVPRMPADALLFVNMHPRDFNDPALLAPEPFVAAHANRLVFEVTERAALGNVAVFYEKVAALRDKGLRIAVDDLGSGYAALSSVAELKPDFIKFDMTLIRDIDQSPIRQNLIRNMVAFADDSNARVVAEGVETKEELITVRELGCHYVQGYYYAMPEPSFVTSVPKAVTPGHSAGSAQI